MKNLTQSLVNEQIILFRMNSAQKNAQKNREGLFGTSLLPLSNCYLG